MENSAYRDLVLEIYQAVSDQTLWSGILDRIAESVSARGCIVFEWQSLPDGRRLQARFFTTGYNRSMLNEYMSDFSRWENRDQDMFERHSLSRDSIELVSEEDLYPNEHEYLAQPHVKQMLDFGIRHRFGSLLDKDNPYRARFAIQRSARKGRFSGEEEQILELLLPHAAKALDLGDQLSVGGYERRTLLALIDRLGVGVCVLDSTGRLALKNALFDQLNDRFRAFRTDRTGLLSLIEPQRGRVFSGLLSDALNHGQFGARPRKEAIIVEAPDHAGSLCIEVAPLQRSPEIGSQVFGGALVICRDMTQSVKIDADLAKIAFGLTKAEAEIVEHVCDGRTNAQIAEHRERSIETINAQVKTILSKSRAANRTQLVRLLYNFAVPQAS